MCYLRWKEDAFQCLESTHTITHEYKSLSVSVSASGSESAIVSVYLHQYLCLLSGSCVCATDRCECWMLASDSAASYYNSSLIFNFQCISLFAVSCHPRCLQHPLCMLFFRFFFVHFFFTPGAPPRENDSTCGSGNCNCNKFPYCKFTRMHKFIRSLFFDEPTRQCDCRAILLASNSATKASQTKKKNKKKRENLNDFFPGLKTAMKMDEMAGAVAVGLRRNCPNADAVYNA